MRKTDRVSAMFVYKYHRAVCLSYLSIQGMSAFDAETESNLDAGGNDQAEISL